jgi:hypothetical protein
VASRADKFLEGFKLGSLGVSRKPKVSSDRVEIVKEGVNKFKDVEFPFFCWKDDDGWTYFLNLEVYNDVDDVVVRFNGGRELVIATSTFSQFRGWFVPGDTEWDVWTRSLRYNKGSFLYKTWISIIKNKGTDGLIDNEVLSQFQISQSNVFTAWLEKKKKGEAVQ